MHIWWVAAKNLHHSPYQYSRTYGNKCRHRYESASVRQKCSYAHKYRYKQKRNTNRNSKLDLDTGIDVDIDVQMETDIGIDVATCTNNGSYTSETNQWIHIYVYVCT